MQAMTMILAAIGAVTVVCAIGRALAILEDRHRPTSPDWSGVDFSLARRRQKGDQDA